MCLKVLLQPGQVEKVAPGALGSGAGEVGLGQQAFEQCRNGAAAGGPLAVVVVAVAMVGLDPAIEQGVGRAGVEAGDCGRGLLRVDDGEIGNAPQVEDAVAALQARKDMGMEGRHQRGALAAGGDVGAAQVGNDIDAGGFGQTRGVKQLQGVALGGHVAYGLAMGAQCAHLSG